MKLRNSNRPVRDAVLRLVGGLGLHVVERTERCDLAALLERLRPVETGLELIRLGPAGDGGYLVPDDLDGIASAFSPGVADESGFELALAERGIDVHLADASVDGPAVAHARFTFVKKHVGCVTDGWLMSLGDWKRTVAADDGGDLLLQMDVEGAEYEVLLSAPLRLLAQFRVLVIEFHHLQHFFDRRFFELASRAFTRLLEHHSVVHVHPNNCCGSVKGCGLEIPRIAEFTFLRNDRFERRAPRRDFPHPLDADNVPTKPPLPLPACWYQ
jgi:hypothetical protein